MPFIKHLGKLEFGSWGGVTTWDSISGKPSTFSPDEHTHVISNVTNLQSTLNGKATTSHSHSEYSLTSHNHNSQYSSLNHTHSAYANKTHSHSEYSLVDHAHDTQYSALDHTHEDYAERTWVTEQLAQLQGSIGAPIDLTDQFRDVAVINIDTNGILYLIVGEKRGIGTPVGGTGGGSGAIISNYPSIFINDQLVVSGALMHGVASHLTEYFGHIKAGDVVTLALERTINGEVHVGDFQPETLIRAILYPTLST